MSAITCTAATASIRRLQAASDAPRCNSNQRSLEAGSLILSSTAASACASQQLFLLLESLRAPALIRNDFGSDNVLRANVSIMQHCTALQRQNNRSYSDSAACNNSEHLLLSSTSLIDIWRWASATATSISNISGTKTSSAPPSMSATPAARSCQHSVSTFTIAAARGCNRRQRRLLCRNWDINDMLSAATTASFIIDSCDIFGFSDFSSALSFSDMQFAPAEQPSATMTSAIDDGAASDAATSVATALQLLQLLQRQQSSFSLCYSDGSAVSSADVPATTLQLSLQL